MRETEQGLAQEGRRMIAGEVSDEGTRKWRSLQEMDCWCRDSWGTEASGGT